MSGDNLELSKLIERRKWLFYYSVGEANCYYWDRENKFWTKLKYSDNNLPAVMILGTTDLRHWPSFPEEDAYVGVYEIMKGKQDSYTFRRISLEEYRKGGY